MVSIWFKKTTPILWNSQQENDGAHSVRVCLKSVDFIEAIYYYTIAGVNHERISLQKILLWYNREIICIIAGYGYYTTRGEKIEVQKLSFWLGPAE